MTADEDARREGYETCQRINQTISQPVSKQNREEEKKKKRKKRKEKEQHQKCFEPDISKLRNFAQKKEKENRKTDIAPYSTYCTNLILLLDRIYSCLSVVHQITDRPFYSSGIPSYSS